MGREQSDVSMACSASRLLGLFVKVGEEILKGNFSNAQLQAINERRNPFTVELSEDCGHSPTLSDAHNQWKKYLEFGRQVVAGGYSEGQLRAIINHENPFGLGLLEKGSCCWANAILGAERVFSARKAHGAWRVSMNQGYRIPYLQETLMRCAQENADGDADWHLIFLFDWNIATVVGNLPNMHIALGGALRECNTHAKNRWGQRKPKMGYYLCNLKPSLTGLSYIERRARLSVDKQHYRTRLVEMVQILAGLSHCNSIMHDDWNYVCEKSEEAGEYQLELKQTRLQLNILGKDECSGPGVVLMLRWDA